MNEISASERLKHAIAEQAEADKIMRIKAAEADAESKYLKGVGVAKQRRAIANGLQQSMVDFEQQLGGKTSIHDVKDLLLLTQYVDMIHNASHPRSRVCRTTLVPSNAMS